MAIVEFLSTMQNKYDLQKLYLFHKDCCENVLQKHVKYVDFCETIVIFFQYSICCFIIWVSLETE